MDNCKQMERLKVEEKIKNSFISLLRKDSHLLKIDINERSLTHQLAIYLASEFPDYDIDCEYNRNGIDKKKLRSFRKEIYSDDTTVYPDIIIHQRGTQNNFMVIEAKKSSNADNDMKKLKAYKKDLNYKYAVFVRFPIGKDLQVFTKAKVMDYIRMVDD